MFCGKCYENFLVCFSEKDWFKLCSHYFLCEIPSNVAPSFAYLYTDLCWEQMFSSHCRASQTRKDNLEMSVGLRLMIRPPELYSNQLYPPTNPALCWQLIIRWQWGNFHLGILTDCWSRKFNQGPVHSNYTPGVFALHLSFLREQLFHKAKQDQS